MSTNDENTSELPSQYHFVFLLSVDLPVFKKGDDIMCWLVYIAWERVLTEQKWHSLWANGIKQLIRISTLTDYSRGYK